MACSSNIPTRITEQESDIAVDGGQVENIEEDNIWPMPGFLLCSEHVGYLI